MSTSDAAATPAPHHLDDGAAARARMSHREILTAMSGLMLGMLVAILSSTVVSTSLPRIINDLGGSQAAYTWVVTSTLLALTVSTPIWGKLADLVARKTLLQAALLIFTLGSVLAGLSQSTSFLIGCRVLQGIGAGGLTALVQVVMSDLVSPRERGRYMGYLGGVMSIGTIGGPLLGGLITDGIGWRWNFYVGVPVALAAAVVLQRTLRLPPRPQREVSIDLLGAALISAGVSALLIWVSLAGHSFAWLSLPTAAMVLGGVALVAAAVQVERRAVEPLIPLHLFGDRTLVLAVLGSIAAGVAMFGTSVFLAQYMQIARGETPTASGLLTLPMIVGVMAASILVGRRVARTGSYKRIMLAGAISLTAGLALMGTISATTSFVVLGVFMALIGAGVGMTMQNLVLVTQNTLPQRDMGSGTALIAFFRSLAGASAVAVLGAILSAHVQAGITDGLARLGSAAAGAVAGGSGAIPDVASLPAPVARVVEDAYGSGIADIFLVAVPAGLLAIVAIALLKERPLGEQSGIERQSAAAAAPTAGTEAAATAPEAAGTPVGAAR